MSLLLLRCWERLPPSTAGNQETICRLSRKVAHVELAVHQFLLGCFPAECPQHVLLHWGVPPQVHNFALPFEFRKVFVSSFPRPLQVPLDGNCLGLCYQKIMCILFNLLKAYGDMFLFLSCNCRGEGGGCFLIMGD